MSIPGSRCSATPVVLAQRSVVCEKPPMMTERVFNFSPGPAVLPFSVIEQIRQDMVALPGTGCSILELSHRGSAFLQILAQAKADLIQLMEIPDNYRIVFLQGGSRMQFSMVPMNLLRGASQPADYLITGSWGSKAMQEAKREGEVRAVWNGVSSNFDRLPAPSEWAVNPQSPYLHFTSNETIQGVQFGNEPEVGRVPLVCDASSDFLSRPIPLEKYGLIYACAQKNAGPAGVTIVVIREDLLERSSGHLPGYLNYDNHVQEDSLYNTPPTFGVYVVGLVVRWLLKEIGGLRKMDQINQQKASQLYEVLDNSEGFYQGHAQAACRSKMNVTFRLPSDELQQQFLQQAQDRKLHNLKGHRSVGGVRASIYNAMPLEGVTLLRDFMQEFCDTHRSFVGLTNS